MITENQDLNHYMTTYKSVESIWRIFFYFHLDVEFCRYYPLP